MVYAFGAVALTFFGLVMYNTMDRDLDFAISLFGSLVGGFLGALLASILILDMSSRIEQGDNGHNGNGHGSGRRVWDDIYEG